MRKGILEYCILLILSREDAYATDIINLLKESKLIVVEGTLYPLLTRQKNAGLLSYRWEESTQGPPAKVLYDYRTGQKISEGARQILVGTGRIDRLHKKRKNNFKVLIR